MRIRRNVHTLPAGDKTLYWYGQAVLRMKARPKTDPRSWKYQAAIHGIDPIPSAQGQFWAQCQHGSSFFLPWHRMYLLHFERIVAADVTAAGGPPDWALPYWNYSAGAAQSLLPAAFRDPTLSNGSPNPLYVLKRSAKANAGSPFLDAKDIALGTCLTAAADVKPAGFFGAAAASHSGASAGALELTPHNAVHRKLGAGGGWMGDPDFAALDPIFWLHHANIDRLWEVWRARDGAHTNLSAPYWLTGVAFAFHDSAGSPVTMKTAEVLATTAPALDYSYDDTSDPLAAVAPAAASAAAFGAGGGTPVADTGELVGATVAPILLDSGVARVDVPTPVTPEAFAMSRASSAAAAAAAAGGPPSALVRRVILQLEHVTSSATAPTYDLYVNVPDAADESAHEDRFVGRAAMFGIAQASRADGPHAGGGQDFAFDITDVYHRLADDGTLDPQSLRVSFVPVEPEGDPHVSVGRIGLYFD
jgi:tyrosinase